MKKSILFLVLFFGLFQTTKMFGQATYNVMYDFYEWGPGTNQGPVDVNFTFNGGVRPCTHHYYDLYEFGNKWVDEFPATATLNTFSLRFEWGGDGNETFNYTSDINNTYQPISSSPSSFWYKKYPLRPFTGDFQYFSWTSNSADWFSTTIWPKNLAIRSVTGPKDQSGLVISQNDQTTLNATAGFPADAYTWKYELLDGSNDTILLPARYQGKSTVSFSGNDLFGSNFPFYVTNNYSILIYVYAKDSLGNPKIYDYRKLKLKLNAPKIVSVTAQPAKCSYSTTSSVIIKMDKPAIAGDTIKFLNLVQGITSNSTTNVPSGSFNANNEYELTGLPVTKNYQINIHDYTGAGGTLSSHYYITPDVFSYNTNLIPAVLQTGLNVSGVYCNGGQDASLTGRVKGGTSPYTLNYTNTTLNANLASHNVTSTDVTLYATDNTTVKNLGAGNYSLAVTDNNGCIATVTNTTINQPAAPLSITSQVETDATGYRLSNGMLQVTLTGGTYGGTSGYFAPTLKSTQGGTVYTAQFAAAQNNQYTFLFNNLPAGNYNFRAEDLNMTHEANLIRDSLGCLAKEIAAIIQPPPLVLTVTQTQPIVCYAAQTAALKGHATGGKPFVTGKPYLYQWSYSQDGIAPYSALTGNDSILIQQPAGFYQLIVTDKNSNMATQTFQVTQPLKVDYDVTIKNVTCLNWTDGALTLSNLRGGTAPYTVAWPDGSAGLSYNGLGQGYYTVVASDALACSTSRTLQVKDTLNEITLTLGSHIMPHCFGDSNGVLGVQVTVASKPYTVLWSNGSTDTLLTNIKAGDYTVQVLNSKNCLKQASFSLHTPHAIPLNIDAERYLCIGQTADYDIAVVDSLYQYTWQGPGLSTTNSNVSLSATGTYTASITDNKGCSRLEHVNIHRVNETIASDFVVSTQVFTGDSVSLVNITQPIVSDTCIWEFTADPNLEVITNSFEYATVIFKKAGTYQVGLRSHLGSCEKLLKKDIIVVDPTFDHHSYAGATSYIKNFDIKPNPNDGNFEVMINLEDIGAVKLRLLDFYSNTDMAEIQQYDAKDYVIPMHVTLAPGTYILFLETTYGTRITKVVIMQ